MTFSAARGYVFLASVPDTYGIRSLSFPMLPCSSPSLISGRDCLAQKINFVACLDYDRSPAPRRCEGAASTSNEHSMLPQAGMFRVRPVSSGKGAGQRRPIRERAPSALDIWAAGRLSAAPVLPASALIRPPHPQWILFRQRGRASCLGTAEPKGLQLIDALLTIPSSLSSSVRESERSRIAFLPA